MQRLFLKIILLLFFLNFQSCKSKYEECTSDDYSNCYTDRPKTGEVEIKISTTGDQPSVTVRLYAGNFEDDKLIWEKTFFNSVSYLDLDVETLYSFTATYFRNGNTILAVDGGKINVSSYQACEYTCYEADLLRVDLRLD
jgi:hypothetical protein